MDGRDDLFHRLEEDLQDFPLVLEELRRVRHSLEGLLSPSDLEAWAQEGLGLAQTRVRGWEAAVEYFRATPEVLPLLPHFLPWAQSGALLCQDSPAMAAAYFRASPESVRALDARQVPGWAHLGHRLYKGTWKSALLATKFFEATPALLRSLSFPQVERFVSFLEAVSARSADLALECLLLGQEAFPALGGARDAFLSLLSGVTGGSWREIKGCFEAAARALPRLEAGPQARFLALVERASRLGLAPLSTLLLEGGTALAQVDLRAQETVLATAEDLLLLAPEALLPFLKSCPQVLGRVSPAYLGTWVGEGVRLLQENREAGLAFFRLESARARELIDALSSAVELEKVRGVLRLYCRALAGSPVEVAPTTEVVQKGIGWVSIERPTTEGTTVYLPPLVDRYPQKADNFTWYKVLATHQVAHLEFGSFSFVYHRPSARFQDLRPRFTPEKVAQITGQEPRPPSSDGLTDMHRFFGLFPDRRLALDIFTVVEDGRLDTRVRAEYPGIRPLYLRVQQDALMDRPPVETLPLRQAFLELLIRLSLGQERGLPIPLPYRREVLALARIARKVFHPEATVEDSAEATLRLYLLLSSLPNQAVPPEQVVPEDLPQDLEEGEEDLENLLNDLEARWRAQPPSPEAEEKPYSSPQPVDYRGEFKPELVQLLAKLKESQQTTAQALSPDMLQDLLAGSPEVEMEQGDLSRTATAQNLLREAGLSTQPPPAFGQGPLIHIDDEGGPLESSEPNTAVYDEWDFRAGDYKPRWCLVRERVLAEGDFSFWQRTLQAYAPLVNQIRRHFEMAVPEAFRKIKRLKDGEDFELDALVEAVVDRRAGITPSEKIYWRRNKIERDVAVAFLLDMSASTAEAIEETQRPWEEADPPDDPMEYMLWLRSRREGVRRSYKRIIDLEKESTVLLIQALEALGDKYGLYGFSGYGRENVEFYTLKDLEEPLTDRVRRRLDKVSPLHATRMGPAVRHATAKLRQVEAKTKFLFLISDGRPQDRGYSREGVEKEYAVHDTRMALLEAKRYNIIPFCLTVDKNGHDYLKAMCAPDIGYEVLSDIQSLPYRLPYLYHRLTV